MEICIFLNKNWDQIIVSVNERMNETFQPKPTTMATTKRKRKLFLSPLNSLIKLLQRIAMFLERFITSNGFVLHIHIFAVSYECLLDYHRKRCSLVNYRSIFAFIL